MVPCPAPSCGGPAPYCRNLANAVKEQRASVELLLQPDSAGKVRPSLLVNCALALAGERGGTAHTPSCPESCMAQRQTLSALGWAMQLGVREGA